ncbi:DUF3854 domain-containing protein [Lysinibacillus sp. NPDC097214]|uniref:DUF3854 domain-containing protein n=1 Tax=Lysinibacillus sp. NPDC097214 TaxID=3390584 RepID=UPI003D0408BA
MQTLRRTKMEGWFEYYREVCPICHKTGGCIRNEEGDLVGCIRVESKKVFSQSPLTYLHFLNDKQKKVTGQWVEKQVTKIDDQFLGLMYNGLIQNQLPLLKEHSEQLKMPNRGLMDYQIVSRGYRSITRSLTNKVVSPTQLKGVPGFYENNGQWKLVNGIEGMLIPYRNVYNEIVGYQIRVDNPRPEISFIENNIPNLQMFLKNDGYTVLALLEGGEVIGEKHMNIGDEYIVEYKGQKTHIRLKQGNRYFWLSSAKKNLGCSPDGPVHISIPSERLKKLEENPSEYREPLRAKSVWLTEGGLKADIAADHISKAFTPEQIAKLGDTFVATAGVQSWANILPVLKELGAEQVNIAFDMDMLTNVYVKQAVTQLLTALKAEKYLINYVVWNSQDGKGIDDLFLASKRPQVRRIGN